MLILILIICIFVKKKINMAFSTPTFEKIELLVNTGTSINKVVFNECDFMIRGDYIIITSYQKNETENTETNTSKVFSLKNVDSYKTYTKII